MEEAENPEQSKHNFSYWDRPSRTAVVKRRRIFDFLIYEN